MARDGSGTYSVPNTFTPNTVMSAAAVNTNFTDAGAELTNSLARDGQSAMSGQLKLWDGTATASALPGLTFGNDPNTGLRRASEDELRLVTGGVDRFYIDSAGKAFALGALQVVGTASFTSVLAIATSSANLLTLRRTENDTTARTVEQYASGSGAGVTADLQVVGDSANGVATMRWRVNSVAIFEATQSLFTHSTNVGVGSSIVLSTAGYVDLAEITAPAAPAANNVRLYAVDSAGTSRLAFIDASSNVSVIGQMTDYQVFTTTGASTWTKPNHGVLAFIQVWGAGASGGKSANDGGGGGGGAYNERWIAVASLSASVAVTVGAGGAAVATNDTSGLVGGDSSFGAYLAAYGGGGGAGTGATAGQGGGGGGGLTSAGATALNNAGGAGGGLAGAIGAETTNTAGNSNPFGGGGGGGGTVAGGHGVHGGGGGGGGEAAGTPGAGGSSIYGGGGGGGGGDAAAGAGGTGVTYGGNGGAGGAGAASGTDGTAPGGGGGGCDNAGAASGAGARGEVRVTVF